MKKLFILFTILMSMVGIKASAYDIVIANENGVDIYYNFINNKTELEVTNKGEGSYRVGNMIIPEEDLVYTFERTANSKSMEGRVIDTIDLITQISSEQYVIINRGMEDGVAKGNRWIVFEQREGLNRLPEGEETHTKYAEEDERSKKNKKDDEEDKDPRDGKIYRDDEHTWVLGRPTQAPEFPPRDNVNELYGDREYTTDDLPLRKIGEILVVDSRDKFCTGIVLNITREIGIDTRTVLIKGF